MDHALRAVRAYLRAHPEVNGGNRVDGDAIVVGIAGDPAEHAAALRELAGDRVVVERVPRPVRELIRLQRRIEDDEAELAAHGIVVRSMSAAPLRGVVVVELDAGDPDAAAALVAERYGDAVAVTSTA